MSFSLLWSIANQFIFSSFCDPNTYRMFKITKMFIHSIFYHFQEKTSPVSKSGTNSPVLSRTQQNILDATSKTAQTLGGLPQATLDLSGPNSRVLELSTLVWNYTWTNWNDNTQIFMSFLWKQGNKTDELSPTLKLLHLKAGECSVMIISKLFWLSTNCKMHWNLFNCHHLYQFPQAVHDEVRTTMYVYLTNSKESLKAAYY